MKGKPTVIAAMDTPMTDDGQRIEPQRIAPLVHFLTEWGVKGLFVAGSTGLGPLLSEDEWHLLVEETLRVSQSIKTLINVSAPSTGQTIERVNFALSRGATDIVVATPSTYRFEKRAVIRYFHTVIRSASPAPVYLYRKADDPWNANDVRELAHAHPHLRGVKDSATNMTEHLGLLAISGLEIYQGYEALLTSNVQSGGAGPVSGLATALPGIVVEMTNEAAEQLAGVATGAGAPNSATDRQTRNNVWNMQQRLTQVRTLVCGTNPYAGFKALLNLQGVPVGLPREPFMPLSDDELRRIVAGLKSFDIDLKKATIA